MIQDVRFYDFDFNLVYIISDWVSLNWELKYNGVGTFEMQLPASSPVLKFIKGRGNLIAVQGDKQAIITGIMLDDYITLHGRTPNWLLSKRVVMPFEMGEKKDIETIIRLRMGEAFDISDNLELGALAGGFEVLEEFALKSPRDMLTFVTDNLDGTGAGHRLTFEPLKHRWLFEVYRGEEKGIILSQANNNAYYPRYTQDILDKADGICYKDKATGGYVTIPATGKGILRWYKIGKADNKADATDELKKLKDNSSLTFETTHIKYGTDYRLGDVFPVETEFGGNKVRKLSRVKSVRIWNEALNTGQSPEFEQVEADANGD